MTTNTRKRKLLINLPWKVNAHPNAEMIIEPSTSFSARQALLFFIDAMTDEQCIQFEEFLRNSNEIEITTHASRLRAKRDTTGEES